MYELTQGQIIEDHFVKIQVHDVVNEYFIAKILELKDKLKEDGHFGKYIAQNNFYLFNKLLFHNVNNPSWCLCDDSSENFHKTGCFESQILLSYIDGVFNFSIDS